MWHKICPHTHFLLACGDILFTDLYYAKDAVVYGKADVEVGVGNAVHLGGVVLVGGAWVLRKQLDNALAVLLRYLCK